MTYLVIYLCGIGAFYLFLTGRRKYQQHEAETVEEYENGAEMGKALARTVIFACALLWPICLPGMLWNLLKRRL